MEFNENLHYLLDCHDMKIKELSAKTGISEHTIKSYLKESSAEPKVTNAVKIARALGVTVEYLAGEESKAEKFSARQLKLLSSYEKLKPHEQKAVSLLIEELVNGK